MSTYPELLLSNQLCFLVYRLDRAILALYRPLLGKLGLTYVQYLALLVLWERPELPVGELCRALALDSGTISPLLKRLESVGLVRKARGQGDERVVIVSLTEKGRALREKARSVPREIVKCLVADEGDYGAIKGTLDRLIDRAEGGKAGRFAARPPRRVRARARAPRAPR